MSFALVLKKTSWYRRRYSRPLRVKIIDVFVLDKYLHKNKKENMNEYNQLHYCSEVWGQ